MDAVFLLPLLLLWLCCWCVVAVCVWWMWLRCCLGRLLLHRSVCGCVCGCVCGTRVVVVVADRVGCVCSDQLLLLLLLGVVCHVGWGLWGLCRREGVAAGGLSGPVTTASPQIRPKSKE